MADHSFVAISPISIFDTNKQGVHQHRQSWYSAHIHTRSVTDLGSSSSLSKRSNNEQSKTSFETKGIRALLAKKGQKRIREQQQQQHHQENRTSPSSINKKKNSSRRRQGRRGSFFGYKNKMDLKRNEKETNNAYKNNAHEKHSTNNINNGSTYSPSRQSPSHQYSLSSIIQQRPVHRAAFETNVSNYYKNRMRRQQNNTSKFLSDKSENFSTKLSERLKIRHQQPHHVPSLEEILNQMQDEEKEIDKHYDEEAHFQHQPHHQPHHQHQPQHHVHLNQPNHPLQSNEEFTSELTPLHSFSSPNFEKTQADYEKLIQTTSQSPPPPPPFTPPPPLYSPPLNEGNNVTDDIQYIPPYKGTIMTQESLSLRFAALEKERIAIKEDIGNEVLVRRGTLIANAYQQSLYDQQKKSHT